MIYQIFIELLNCFFKVTRKFDLFPQPVGKGRPFYRLHKEVANTVLLPDGGVLGVRQRARRSVAKAGQVVLIPAELLRLGLRLVLTERLVDDRPDDVVVLHLDESGVLLTFYSNLKKIFRCKFKISIRHFYFCKQIVFST